MVTAEFSMQVCSGSREEALVLLAAFLPKAGTSYTRNRNFDLGAGQHKHVSQLSAYIKRRIITEEDVLKKVLSAHSLNEAGKFIDEIFWRTYFKGWLESRPHIWMQYCADVHHLTHELQTQSGLRDRWAAACLGETGIDCFDAWAKELAETGYLHNHARMWFASIWVYTLQLPWQLGADFFLRHLLDGDAASNTLSWRWVVGLHSVGKTYLARAENIQRFTNGRFVPKGLAQVAPPLNDTASTMAPKIIDPPNPYLEGRKTGLLLHSDDLNIAHLTHRSDCIASAAYRPVDAGTMLVSSPKLLEFNNAALDAATKRWKPNLLNCCDVTTPEGILSWALENKLEQVVTPYAAVGNTSQMLEKCTRLLSNHGVQLTQVMREYDIVSWPYATKGFFKFREKIPKILTSLSII
ncbi:FAD-binding domain-containing protein [Alphaproteobacteria bacterium US3C007]|nr:FAD-binding domain-containing protein [Alphaproteobacteria bacterium US3C007]